MFLWDSNINNVVTIQPCIQRGKTGDVNNVDNGKKSSPGYLVSALIIPKSTGDKVKLTRCYDNSFRVGSLRMFIIGDEFGILFYKETCEMKLKQSTCGHN